LKWVALANDIAQVQGKVTFSAKDYRHGGKQYLASLSEKEFIRRFSMHILPKGFTRIRHYGILSSSLKKAILPMLQEELGVVCLSQRAEIRHRKCYYCGSGQLVTVMVYYPRGPPIYPAGPKKLLSLS
jgi:hypothetical protein